MQFDIWHIMTVNLVSAPVLFFILGAIAVLVKSDLKVPDDVGRAIVIFLVASIGLRAGEEIAQTPGGILAMLPLVLAAVSIGICVAGATYFIR